MIEQERIKKILFGGDYNPEQWPEEIWEEDMRLFKLAHVDTVTINVFSWAMLQPSEEVYDFSKLDKIMEMAKKNHLNVCLATSTGAHPAWMARKHPDILRADAQGIKRQFGSRHNSCPNSKTYRYYAPKLAAKIAERYKGYDNIVAWHISNEFGGECHCDNCQKAFRVWLKEKYGTIENLNVAWNMAFWGHTLYDFEDVVLPDLRSEEFLRPGRTCSSFQGISLDYKRFNSDSLLECFRLERDAVRTITPNIPITTNLMGTYKPLDYQKWAKEMDFISWDNYPEYDAIASQVAFSHDLMRGIKQGKPFALMEQTPSVSNWHPYCALKRPGVMRLYSYQAVAHGADTILFFQMRRSKGACEKYHGALIDHCGHEHTRVFKEMSALGEELERLGSAVLGGCTQSEVAIVFDWDNWWASELSAGPSQNISYLKEVQTYYHYFHSHHIPVDIVGVDEDLSQYKMVIAPLLYMCKESFDQKLRDYTKNGGCFVTTYFSGYVEDHDLVVGAYPGRLKDLLGIWVEEIDALPPETSNYFDYNEQTYPAMIACDLLHTKTAKALSTYKQDFYAGMPAVTKNQYGDGQAYYIATHSNDAFYEAFFDDLTTRLGIFPITNVPQEIEATIRQNKNGNFLFLLNHSQKTLNCVIDRKGKELLSSQAYQKGETLTFLPYDVKIIKF